MNQPEDKKQEDLRLRSAAERQIEKAPRDMRLEHSAEKLLHELQVHQVELEMQNETLIQAQVELADARDRYVNLYEFAPVGYLTLSSDGIMTEVNLTATTLFGIERKALLRRSLATFVVAEDLDHWEQHFLNVKRGGGQGQVAVALLRGDGNVFQARLDCMLWGGSAFGVCPEGGAAPRAISTLVMRVTLSDITESRAAELKVIKATLALRETLDAMRDGMVAIDLGGRVQSVNQAICGTFGYTEAELIGQNVSMLMPEPDRSRHDAYLHNYRRTGVEKIIGSDREVTGKRKDGSTFPMELSVVVASDIHGGSDHYLGTIRDITARKETEEQLRASQKMEAVGQLTAGIAHDFNNLLAVISANLELLEEEVEGSPKLTKRVKAALKAVDRGADLTQHLLAFGRNQALSPKRLNLCDVVQQYAKLIKRTMPESVAIQVMADPKAEIWVNVDDAQLENALLNLSLNARDAMPGGGILLFSLGTRGVGAGNDERRKSVPPGRYGVITVQDTGKGMSAEVMAKAFDPFFTTKQVGQGTGLGLSMVYGFVRQSGGRAHLTSTEGKGTTCTLLFPLVDGADKDATSGESAKAISKLIGPRKVLLVEDMADVRESIKTQLESLGLEVTTAEDATVGLEALLSSGQTFDLLLTDLGLPGEMDGDDLAKVAAEKSPGMKIITMSGYNNDRISRSSFNLPTTHPHLRKPFKRTELHALMVSCL